MQHNWVVVPADKIQGGVAHVVPLDDTEDHFDNGLCPCSPELKFDGESKAIFHKAFDGRQEPVVSNGALAHNGISK